MSRKSDISRAIMKRPGARIADQKSPNVCIYEGNEQQKIKATDVNVRSEQLINSHKFKSAFKRFPNYDEHY